MYMATKHSVELAVLRFEGKRFEGHAVDVECTRELIAYRTLILECAKELWRKKNPDRVRLPKGFEEGFRVEFDRVTNGSAAIPLRRVRDAVQGELLDDEFDEAAALIDTAISAADADELLPDDLPANVVPLFGDFGRSLRSDEVMFTKARNRRKEAPYTAKARTRLAEWTPPVYEDRVDVVGEVRMANLGPGAFSLQMSESGPLVNGRFDERQEALVLDALKNHRSVRLRVKGIGEFSTRDRQIRNLVRIDEVSFAPMETEKYDDTAPPIWEQLAEIGKQAPQGTWDAVPKDLSKRIDEIVYGEGEGSR
jgi:hypothetical protein